MRNLVNAAIAVALVGAGSMAVHAAAPDAKITYSAPPQARAIAPLRSWLDRDAAQVRAKTTADAAADRRQAARDGRPFIPYEASRVWKVVTDTPRFLSLSLEAYDFTGGAHGNTAWNGMVWDKATRQRIAPIAFFTGKPTLTAAVKPAFCRQLDAERHRKRSGQSSGDIPEFSQCIAPADQTVILGSSNGRQFNRIGFLIAPYNAGPYAEGSYDVTLPVTPAIIAAVKPEWRRYFAIGAR